MTAAEQLADMADKAMSEPRNWSRLEYEDRLDEYRAVLRWFRDRVNERAATYHAERNDDWLECLTTAMADLLRELGIDSEPESRCCRICGEVVNGPKYDGLCGLCYDDQLNKK